MIIQSSDTGAESVIIHQLEHTRMAGRLAAVWGNDTFTPLVPRELMEYLVVHHDEGWDAIDQHIERDPDTGLPYNLVRTPLPLLVRSSKASPDFNERHHPFCGLLSSMHSYGLFHGRYGLSDKVFVNLVPAEHKPAVMDMLDGEVARQERIKAELGADPGTAPWVEQTALFCNYKRLQFFDTLALYFNCTPEASRGRSSFANVPRTVDEDVTVTIDRVSPGVYRLDPYPFVRDGVEVPCEGRLLAPQPEGTDMPAALNKAPVKTEVVTLVR